VLIGIGSSSTVSGGIFGEGGGGIGAMGKGVADCLDPARTESDSITVNGNLADGSGADGIGAFQYVVLDCGTTGEDDGRCGGLFSVGSSVRLVAEGRSIGRGDVGCTASATTSSGFCACSAALMISSGTRILFDDGESTCII